MTTIDCTEEMILQHQSQSANIFVKLTKLSKSLPCYFCHKQCLFLKCNFYFIEFDRIVITNFGFYDRNLLNRFKAFRTLFSLEKRSMNYSNRSTSDVRFRSTDAFRKKTVPHQLFWSRLVVAIFLLISKKNFPTVCATIKKIKDFYWILFEMLFTRWLSVGTKFGFLKIKIPVPVTIKMQRFEA